ncbi:MAG: type II methionyl aminopeptidase [Candidatus Methanomethylicota archaeon]|uniref:Methionine aminopeptidase n=1 Tax=Thermoproteota archaeon TaxID=2056631 RepID=A0A497F3U9_9CREN|nr:MAG: type II methionyl aminopeptidase [Candidatus Verstraetearchaeota archaeon]
MEAEEIELYVKAGKIAKAVVDIARSYVKKGARLLDICENLESEIARLGGKPAFPVNIAINHIAAHYTPFIGDDTRVPDGSLVKVDVGAHVNGRIADVAVTVDVGSEYGELIVAAEEALDKALEKIAPKVRIVDISSVIEKTIKYYGFKPIVNLTGHELSPYVIHAGTTIPNVWSPDLAISSARFEPGHVYAIEPFVTVKNALGEVENGPGSTIYRLIKAKSSKGFEAIFNFIHENYRTLPFAQRWIERSFGKRGVELLNRMVYERMVMEYPVLIEKSRGPVAQAEHTVLITDKEVLVTTLN